MRSAGNSRSQERSRTFKCAVFVLAALIGLSVPGWAASGSLGGLPAYDLKAEVVVKGVVTEVTTHPDWMGWNGTSVTLQTRDGVSNRVMIATADFLKFLDFTIAQGDTLEVTGAWVTVEGSTVLLARTVRKERVVISVRDPNGRPNW